MIAHRSMHLPAAAWRAPLLGALASLTLAMLPLAWAGEGGVTHVQPGTTATITDLPPTKPGNFIKPMYANYHGTATARIPTAAGVVADLQATTNTVVLGGGHTFDQTLLGGAH